MNTPTAVKRTLANWTLVHADPPRYVAPSNRSAAAGGSEEHATAGRRHAQVHQKRSPSRKTNWSPLPSMNS